MKILVISWRMPWDTAGTGGQKTHNYYLKKLAEQYKEELLLLSFIEDYNLGKCDLDQYGISHRLVVIKKDFLNMGIRYIHNISSNFNINNKYGGIVPEWYLHRGISEARKIKKDGFLPDIIILEWTQMLFLERHLRKIFPEAKIVASEHDVSYLSYSRKKEKASSSIGKRIATIKFNNLFKSELKTLQNVDLVFTHNVKDRDLLINDGISPEKVDWIVPYYMETDEKFQYKPDHRDIIFYGAMGREENYSSAIWFIENVMDKLENESIRFIVMGGNPAEELRKYESERVIITGFVDDIYSYFRNALCLVAPLLLGGGIKIKVLEGLAYGVPVLTNHIGIEGIPGVNRKNYIHCETADDYVIAINDMLSGIIPVGRLCKEEICLIRENFDKEKSFCNYNQRLIELTGKQEI